MKPRFFITLSFVTLLAIIFSGCSSSQNTPSLDPTQAVQLLAGEYTTVISAEDIKNFTYSSDPNLNGNQGAWRINLTDDGKFKAELNGGFIANGFYSIKGNEMEIGVDQVCADCGCLNSIDRYYWALKDDQLTFTHKAGSCTDLRLLLTVHPLARTP